MCSYQGFRQKPVAVVGEPSGAGFNVPIKVFEILIHVRKMPLLKDSLRQ